MTPQSVLSRKAGNMSDEMEPVAKTPEFGETAGFAPEVELTEATETSAKTSGVTKWPWAVVAGIALVAGVGGFAIGQTSGGNGINVNTVGDHRGIGQDGRLQPNGPAGKGGPGMGPHCEDTTGQHAAVNADGSCPDGFTLDDKGGMMGNGQGMMPGNGANGQMPMMGPHCEDTTGQHAPINADGSCPTGFTLDDKQKSPQGGVVTPAPSASGATS